MPLIITEPPLKTKEFLRGIRKGIFPTKTRLERAIDELKDKGVSEEKIRSALIQVRVEAERAGKSSAVKQIDDIIKKSLAEKAGEFIGGAIPYIPAFGVTGRVAGLISPIAKRAVLKEAVSGAGAFPLVETYKELVGEGRLPSPPKVAESAVVGGVTMPVLSGVLRLGRRLIRGRPPLPYREMTEEEVAESMRKLAEIPEVRVPKTKREPIRALPSPPPIKAIPQTPRSFFVTPKGEVIEKLPPRPPAMPMTEEEIEAARAKITEPSRAEAIYKAAIRSPEALERWQKAGLLIPPLISPELNELMERLKEIPLELERKPLWP